MRDGVYSISDILVFIAAVVVRNWFVVLNVKNVSAPGGEDNSH